MQKSWSFLCGQQLEKIRPNREHFCKALESENEQALAYEIFAPAPQGEWTTESCRNELRQITASCNLSGVTLRA